MHYVFNLTCIFLKNKITFAELRVWGREEFLPALEGLPEKLALVFSEIAQYWQVPLPLKRLDIVALPNYQGVKPADNWGLIVFK